MLNGRGNLQKALSRFCDNEQSSSELGSTPDKCARWPLRLPRGGHFFNPDTPPRHSYHSDRVIVRSASRRRYADKWRTLARATSGSLTTRIPRNASVTECNAGRVGVRATSEYCEPTATVEVESEKRSMNSGKTEVQSLKAFQRVKAASVSESRKNSSFREER